MATADAHPDGWEEESRKALILALTWTFTAIGLLCVGFRVFVQATIRRKFNKDDYLSILCIAFIVVSVIITTISVHYGLGQHLTTLTPYQTQRALLYFAIASFIGVPTLGVGKLAAIALLTRLLNPSRTHRIILWLAGLTSWAILFSVQAVVFFQCRPVRALWDFDVEGQCVSPTIQLYLSYFVASFSAALDFYLAMYPAIQVYQLKLALRKKIGVIAALGVGYVAGAVAIYKTVELKNIESGDLTYDFCIPHFLTIIETNIVLLAACIPVLQPLLDIMRGKNPFKSINSSPYADQIHSASGGGGSGSGGDTELSHKRKSKRDKYGFTINDQDDDRYNDNNEMRDKTESQQHIIGSHDLHMTDPLNRNPTRHLAAQGQWHIVQTTDYSVQYDNAI